MSKTMVTLDRASWKESKDYMKVKSKEHFYKCDLISSYNAGSEFAVTL